jgi:DNA-binding NarL/FixJ family response regulator
VAKRSSDLGLLTAIRRVAAGERCVDPSLGAKLVIPEARLLTEPLSARVYDVVRLLALGYTNQEIGRMLFISVRTVDTHWAHVMRRLGLGSRAELLLYALANGLIGAS